MTIEQTIVIPYDRRITLDVPPEIPAGTTARFKIHWTPQKEDLNNFNAALEEIWALCKDVPITVDSFFEERRRDNELEENQYRQTFPNPGKAN